MTRSRTVILTVGVLALYAALLYLAIWRFTGAGDGSPYFAEAMLSPFSFSGPTASLGFLFWPTVVALALVHRPACRKAVIALLATHYLGLIAISYRADWPYVGTVWRSAPGLVLAFSAAYIAGQLVIWLLISKRHIAAKPAALSGRADGSPVSYRKSSAARQ